MFLLAFFLAFITCFEVLAKSKTENMFLTGMDLV